ncbi:MAG: hypothetical protein ACP5SG_03630 [Dissulfurimicrobium sp.]|uniref:hypothetical protein n=1 Tax=Dissulfurimicrobium sp. TaxID=2022436 RepID=UPI003D0FA5AC
MLKNPVKIKQLHKGLLQLSEKGAVQLFQPILGSSYILGAVGLLQFEVTMAQLKAEYGVDAICEGVDYTAARWVSRSDRKNLMSSREKIRSIWPWMPRAISYFWLPASGGSRIQKSFSQISCFITPGNSAYYFKPFGCIKLKRKDFFQIRK